MDEKDKVTYSNHFNSSFLRYFSHVASMIRSKERKNEKEENSVSYDYLFLKHIYLKSLSKLGFSDVTVGFIRNATPETTINNIRVCFKNTVNYDFDKIVCSTINKTFNEEIKRFINKEKSEIIPDKVLCYTNYSYHVTGTLVRIKDFYSKVIVSEFCLEKYFYNHEEIENFIRNEENPIKGFVKLNESLEENLYLCNYGVLIKYIKEIRTAEKYSKKIKSIVPIKIGFGNKKTKYLN